MSKTLAGQIQPSLIRAALIAVNAAEDIPRDQALRLAASIERWTRGQESLSVLARSLSVAPASIRTARALLARASQIARTEIERAAELGARIITRSESDYPNSLFDLELPPAALYCRGKIPRGPAVAVVGSRKADPYGLEIAERFSSALAAHGVVIISGFARGIDSAAHRGALAGGGRTVAILGCGVDVDYPRGQRKLARKIATHGALISEFRMGTQPEAWHFPVRNRIIAALAAGTLVVRAAARSGSLITARHSLELGRDVYAIPGNIFDQRSAGANTLIRDGAFPIQHPRDILEALPLALQDKLTLPAENEGAVSALAEPLRSLLEVLPFGEPMPQDEVVTTAQLPVPEVLGGLFELEIKGWARRYPGPAYCRRK